MGLRNFLHRSLAPLIYGDGFAVVPARINHEWAERQFLRRFLKRLGVDCVFDVGANIGEYGSDIRTLGYRGLIMSFEPDPSCFAHLSARAAPDPNWHVFNTALGSAVGEGEFNVMAVPVFNSFRAPSIEETNSFQTHNSVVERIKVPIETLGRLLPELQARYRFARPYLKMDTQGFELEIFRGAEDVHRLLVGVQSEVSVKRIYDDVVPWTEAIAEYEQAGFELAALYPVNPHLPQLVEFDCFLVPRDSATLSQSSTTQALGRAPGDI